MDVVGNNIANVNTSGYKYARINCDDTLSQTVSDTLGTDYTRDYGTISQIATIGVVRFLHANGLLLIDNSVFRKTPNSGAADLGAPQVDGPGAINSDLIETSNIDLAQQFILMIVAERDFHANSRIIASADEMLQDLANIKLQLAH